MCIRDRERIFQLCRGLVVSSGNFDAILNGLPVPLCNGAVGGDQIVCTGIEDVYKRQLAASVVREGGAAANVCRMAFGDKLGFRFADGLTCLLYTSIPRSSAFWRSSS